MSRSEIFDAYEKIAIESGLVSSDVELEKHAAEEKKDSPAMKRYKKSPAPRAGSDDISTIEALYGVKTDNTVKYEHNIFEAAHPNAVIIGPAYDRMNGLIENPNERQNFIINMITDKCNNGNLTQHRYAKQELLMELIRVANDLDARGIEPLRVLADSCIELISSEKKSPEIKKEAFVFIPWLVAAGFTLAGVYLWNHIDDPSHGITNDIARCQERLKTLIGKHYLSGDVDEVVRKDVADLQSKLNFLSSKVSRFGNIIASLDNPQMPENKNQLVSLKQVTDTHGNNVKQGLSDFKQAIDDIIPTILLDIKKFTSDEYQSEHTYNTGIPGWIGEVSEWAGEALHGRYGLFANDFISAANALGALSASLQNVYRKTKNIDQTAASITEGLTSDIVKWKGEAGKPNAATNAPKQPSSILPNSPFQGDDERIEDDVSMAEDSYVNAAKALGFKPRSAR